MTREKPRLLGAERRGSDHRQVAMSKDQLHAAVREMPYPRRLAKLAQLGQALLEVAQMAVDVERALRTGIGEGVEMLVARERARLVV